MGTITDRIVMNSVLKTHILRSALAMWVGVSLVLGALLILLHDGPLPVGAVDPEKPSGRWSVLHILAMQCPCSDNILPHLLDRQALADVTETIVLVDGNEGLAQRFRRRGYRVECLLSRELEERYGQAAAPLLIVRDPRGNAAYAGAYSARPQQPPQDLEIIRQLRAGKTVRGLAVSGCAVSRALQRRVDPLKLKYGNWR